MLGDALACLMAGAGLALGVAPGYRGWSVGGWRPGCGGAGGCLELLVGFARLPMGVFVALGKRMPMIIS